MVRLQRHLVIALLTCIGGFILVNPASAKVPRPAPQAAMNYNTILGTQAIGGSYQFTSEPPLIESAKAILKMGSNTIKFSLAAQPLHVGLPAPDAATVNSDVDLVRLDPVIRSVFQMPFRNYILWTYALKLPGNQFQPPDYPAEYKQMYDLTRYLLQTYQKSGKTFYLGNWEGDWHLLHLNPNYVPTSDEVQDMIGWVNTRQRAVDDAKRDTPHQDVQVYYYLEVNRVQDAMQGKIRMTNDVLPKTNVDYVSYSAYDSLGGDITKNLTSALNYIEQKLPPKAGVTGKRVFIGEYGFPAINDTPQQQDALSCQVMRTGIHWGCPFVLYWELFNNETTKDGKQRGYWLINNKDVPQPVYLTLNSYYKQAHQYIANFSSAYHRLPSAEEFQTVAVNWLTASPAATTDSARQTASSAASPVLQVPSVLSNGMMVQQNRPIHLWGNGTPGQHVSATLQNADSGSPIHAGSSTVNATGTWSVYLPAMHASYTKYQIVLRSGATHSTISNILVGEVWVSAGQSNMQLAVQYILNADKILADAHNPNLRFFCQDHIPNTAASGGHFSQVPMFDVSAGLWVTGDSASAIRSEQISGIGYTFAQALFQALNRDGHEVPVAILNTATGNTNIKSWLSRPMISSSMLLKTSYPKIWYIGTDWQQGYNQATAEYNHKIAPLTPFGIRGILWAQGENNVGNQNAANYYAAALKELITGWRSAFGAPNAPFIAAEIAPHFYYNDLSTAAELREAQIDACASEPKSVALPVYDLPLTWNTGSFRYKNPIHPLDKTPVGERLARAALALAYHRPVAYLGPVYSGMHVDGSSITLRFSHVGTGLTAAGPTDDLHGFTICGADRVFFPAAAQIKGNTVIVTSPSVPHPVAANYAFTSMNQNSNLRSADGLPANPFRTDRVPSHCFAPQPWMDCDTNSQWVDTGSAAGAQPCWIASPGSAATVSIAPSAHNKNRPVLCVGPGTTAAAGASIDFQPVLPTPVDISVFGGLRLDAYNCTSAPVTLLLRLTASAHTAGAVVSNYANEEISAALPPGPGWSHPSFAFRSVLAAPERSIQSAEALDFTLIPKGGVDSSSRFLLWNFHFLPLNKART